LLHHRFVQRSLRALPLTLALVALPAATAGASTLSYEGAGKLVYTDGSGGSDIGLDGATGGRVSLQPDSSDPVASLPAGCTQDDEYEPILCTATQLRMAMNGGNDSVRAFTPLGMPLVADGGEGDDDLSSSHESSDRETFTGGAGNDALEGWGGDDHLDGGDGNDSVQGGAGVDTVLGGNGTDKVRGDDDVAVNPDRIDGGPGYDTLSFEWADTQREGLPPVAVTLGGGNDDGFPGEADDVTGIEKLETHTSGRYVGTDAPEEFYGGGDETTVAAGGGDDTIYTSYGNDAIDGGAGNDTIRGYDGNDAIVGGPGADVLIGDTLGQTCNVLTCSTYIGNDVIDARDGERDSLDCGLGADTAIVDAVDVHTNCETVQVAGAPAAPPAAPVTKAAPRGRAGTSGTKLTIARTSLRKALRSGLRIRITGAKPGRRKINARAGRTLVARCTVKVSRAGTGRCVLRFTKTGKRKLRRAKRVTLKLSAAGVSQRITLKR
jgi:Ca2+-binding RTX toxin-like protein